MISSESSEEDDPDAEMEGRDRTRSRLFMRGLLIAEHMDATLREELLPPLLAVASGGLLDVVVVVDAVPNERADASSGPVSVEGNLIARGRHRFGVAEILVFIICHIHYWLGETVGRIAGVGTRIFGTK